MKKVRLVLAVMMTGLLLFGCRGKSNTTSTFNPARSSIFIERDGGVLSALVEPYEADYYEQEELRVPIEKEVAAFSSELGRNAVTLSSFTVGNGKAIALFEYESIADLCGFVDIIRDKAFQVENLVFSAVKDGLTGSEGSLSWKKGKDGSDVSEDAVKKKGDLNLVTVDGTVTVQTEGRIQYYSGDVTLDDEFTATVKSGRAYLIFQ